MDFSSDSLLLFILFFIPGFISIKVYDLLVPGDRRDFSKSIFDAVAYSAFNYALLSAPIILIHSNNFYGDHKKWYLVIVFIIMFIAPIIWPFFALWLRKRSFVLKHIGHPLPTPWDYVFKDTNPSWVIVHLKNGRKIGGKFGKNSFASQYPLEEQLYLQEVWRLDENDRFIEAIDRTKGMIILKDEIFAVELLS